MLKIFTALGTAYSRMFSAEFTSHYTISPLFSRAYFSTFWATNVFHFLIHK